MTRLYFGYGSNLNFGDWHRWCRDHGFGPNLLTPRFPAFLPDRQLAFTRLSSVRNSGVLDVVPACGHLVAGFVFEVGAEGWAALERKEGAPVWYRAFETDALTPDGRAHRVRSFEVVPEARKPFVNPKPDYLAVVRDGYLDFGIEATALEQAAANVPSSALGTVFAYGTLMRGEQRSEFVADRGEAPITATVRGTLHDCTFYPGLIPEHEAARRVSGEVYTGVDARLLDLLDDIEGFPGFDTADGLFRRRIIDAECGDGRIARAWMYALHHARGRPVIASGDWRAHRRMRPAIDQAYSPGHGRYRSEFA